LGVSKQKLEWLSGFIAHKVAEARRGAASWMPAPPPAPRGQRDVHEEELLDDGIIRL
jgi:hypothetical protein